MTKEELYKLKKIFNEDSIINSIILTNDSEFIKSVIEDEKLLKDLGIKLPGLLDLILATEDSEYIKKKALSIIDNNSKSVILDNKKRIHLPPAMTLGIEIESVGINSFLIEDFINACQLDWKAVEDFSVDDGVEVVSPVLRGDNQERTYRIIKICEFLKTMDQEGNDNCGGHIHIGADFLKTTNSWKNLLEIWGNMEKILFIVSNKEGEVPRSIINLYTKPISGHLQQLLDEDSIELENEDDLKKLALNSQKNKKWSAINFKNVGNDKNTIEFRIPNGTVDYETWIDNINLFGGIVNASLVLSYAQAKKENERTEFENKLLENFEKLKEEGLSDEEKLEALLRIAITEEDRDIYRRRYRVNSNLIHKMSDEHFNETEEEIAKKAIQIKLKANDIGRNVFLGDDAINGQEYDKIVHMFESFLRGDTYEK